MRIRNVRILGLSLLLVPPTIKIPSINAQTIQSVQSPAEINLLNNLQKCLTKLNQERKSGISSVNTAKEIMTYTKKADTLKNVPLLF